MSRFSTQFLRLLSQNVKDYQSDQLSPRTRRRKRWAYEEVLPVELLDDLAAGSSASAELQLFDTDDEEYKAYKGIKEEIQVRSDFAGERKSGDKVIVARIGDTWQILGAKGSGGLFCAVANEEIRRGDQNRPITKIVIGLGPLWPIPRDRGADLLTDPGLIKQSEPIQKNAWLIGARVGKINIPIAYKCEPWNAAGYL